MNKTVLVTRATGNTGRPLVELLRQRGVQMHAMVRSAADREQFAGMPVVVADFNDPGGVAAALAGVERAYLVTPSSEQAQAQQERFVELAAQAGVQHLVKLSQLGADEASPVRFLRYHAAVRGGSANLASGSPSCDPTCTSRACSPSLVRSVSRAGSSLRSATPE
jgi:uncharacterized protein YbjT (DUF2867 family)